LIGIGVVGRPGGGRTSLCSFANDGLSVIAVLNVITPATLKNTAANAIAILSLILIFFHPLFFHFNPAIFILSVAECKDF
jgi:hypothetical protein